MRFDPGPRARLRRLLLQRGRVLSERLAEVLAGTAPPQLTVSGVDLGPGARPEDLLRRALAQVEARRALLDAADDRYGRCDACGVDLGLAALDELAWADRCAAHSDG